LLYRLSESIAGNQEEITMYPYQLSKVLADQRIHDMVAAAERNNMTVAARRHHQGLVEQPSRLTVLTAQIRRTAARLFGRRRAGARATATFVSDAGPMGCSA
jgi:sulfur carrier protein ThiS